MRPNPQLPVDLITYTEKIRNGKLHILRYLYRDIHLETWQI